MFVSINWIKEYVDLEGLDIKSLINSFTLATAEVEDIIGLDCSVAPRVSAKTGENVAENSLRSFCFT